MTDEQAAIADLVRLAVDIADTPDRWIADCGDPAELPNLAFRAGNLAGLASRARAVISALPPGLLSDMRDKLTAEQRARWKGDRE